MLSQRHAAERLQTCWHGGGLSLEDVRKQMRDALDEFMVAGSSSEVAAVSAWGLVLSDICCLI
jgi:broad specificity phosphatase PhoE